MDNILISDIHFNPENELWHHGVMGMKWGIRRYQPYSLIPRKSGKGGKEQGAAKKTKGKSKSNSVGRAGNTKVKKIVGVKKSRNQKSAEDKAAIEKQAKTARQRKEELDKVVKSGDAKLVYEHRSELTNKQLNDAIERINTEARVKALVSSQNPSKMKKLKDFAKNVDDLNSVVRTGINAYNTASDIVKISKGLKEASEKKSKAEASAAILKNIVDAGATAKDVRELQSQLSDSDLKKLKDRVKNLDEIGKVERGDEKRAKDAEKQRSAYLKKSLQDLEDAKEADSKLFNISENDDVLEKKDKIKRKGNGSSTPERKSNNANDVASKPISEIDNSGEDASKRKYKQPEIDPEEFMANVKSGARADPADVKRILDEIDRREQAEKRRTRIRSPKASKTTYKTDRAQSFRSKHDQPVDSATFWSNATKVVSRSELEKTLREIDEMQRPVKRLGKKKK